MAKRKERIYHWYVEPLDANTNAAIMGKLGGENEERAMRDVPIYDGTRHDLYLVDGQVAFFLQLSKVQASLRFRTYSQEGAGQIKPYTIRRRQIKAKMPHKIGGSRRSSRTAA